MLHPVVFGAIIVSGMAILGFAVYEQYKEQQRYEQFQQNNNRSQGEYQSDNRQNAFRHSYDFDFEDGSDNDEKQHSTNEDRYTLRTENSELRNRKPFPAKENGDDDDKRKVI
jgi:hypothetical protein